VGFVEIRGGALYFHGRRYFPFGGEVQYFRLRDKNFNARETQAVWGDTLDQMKRAGMNFVTTYVPWNYHESEPDKFDFSGARDLDKFLEMCAQRDMLVQVKPGPYITAEWPYGPRSFGAVPAWLLERHPETMVLDRKGRPFSVDPLGAKWARQCTYMHPLFLERVRKWFEAVAPIILKYIRDIPCVFSLQVDNETNLFWADRYRIDFNPVALAHFRKFLEDRYGDIGSLNEACCASYSSFDEVEPPRKSRRNLPEHNARHIDWFDAGWAYVRDFLVELRRMWGSLGIGEPDVLFTTNDTHALLPVVDWKLLWPRPAQKAVAGLATLDAYPRNNPLSRALDDLPYQTAFTTRLLDAYGDDYPAKNGSWVMGAEMQGGMFHVPIMKMGVRPEATERIVTQAIGNGVKAYATFVIREGYNLDNSIYHFQAPINYKGEKTPRFDVLEKAATSLAGRMGDKLLESEPAEAQTALLVNTSYQAPAAGAKLNPMELWNRSYAGVYGWLIRAGYAVEVADIKEASDLSRWKAAVYLDPGLIGAEEATKMADYMESGGSLIHIGWPSDADLCGCPTSIPRRWLRHFPSRFLGTYRKKMELAFFNGEKRSVFNALPPLFIWEVANDTEVFLKSVVGGSFGTITHFGAGRLIHMSFDIGRIFNSGRLYNIPVGELEALSVLAGKIMGLCGVSATIECQPPKVEAWPRFVRSSGDALVFVVNDGVADDARIKPLEGWNIDPDKKYRLYRAWEDTDLGTVSGRKLMMEGFSVRLKKLGCEVILVEKIE